MTAPETGESIPVKIVNVSNEEAVAFFEFRGTAAPTGSVIVEVFTESNHLVFPATSSPDPPPNAYVFRPSSQLVQSATNCDLNLLIERVPVHLKHNYQQVKACAIAGGERGMAILVDSEIPAQAKIEVTITEDGRDIVTDGFVTHSIKRGKKFIVIYQFQGLARVTMMYWNRIVKAG